MSANVWPDRLSALDVSRAVASLGVVMFHWPHLAGVFAVSDVLKSRASQPFYGVLKLFYENGYMGGYLLFSAVWLYFLLVVRRFYPDKKNELEGLQHSTVFPALSTALGNPVYRRRFTGYLFCKDGFLFRILL